MKVLVTGVDGYIGSVLAPFLIREGFDVVGIDTGYYRDGWLYTSNREMPRTPTVYYQDLRAVTESDLEGVDAVVHLAELSNDPLGANNPEVTRAINHRGSIHLAELAKKCSATRFVYTSSCSVYGIGKGDWLTEESRVDPQTAYAECKVAVEKDLQEMADSDFCPVMLRNATAYGASPRMRFDIVLNNLAGLAWTTNRIAMTSDGTPWRPLVHIRDICQAIRCALAAPESAVRSEVFNVGHDGDNYQVRQIAEIVADAFRGCEVSFGPADPDNRSYRVSFKKISERLPGFSCQWDAKKGAEQLREVFERIAMSPDTFEFRAFTRLKQLEYLLRTEQIDENFYWK
jgi:nucleoside-diphosphate-sugar epimerase